MPATKTTSEVVSDTHRRNDLRGPVAAAVLAITTLGAASQPSAYREALEGTTVNFEMVLVTEGKITVGGTARQVGPFYIGKTEVTWDMYDVFALGLDTPAARPAGVDATARPSHPYGAPDYGWGHAGFPAISVTRQAAEAFAKWLSQKTGRVYRLPTGLEWQHAARLAAGADGLTPDERETLAWHRGNASAHSHAVATKTPDRLGLFDLFGNAAEWVMTDGPALVTRGGSFRSGADEVGPAARAEQDEYWNERDPQLPKSRWWLSDGPFVGFRLVSEVSK